MGTGRVVTVEIRGRYAFFTGGFPQNELRAAYSYKQPGYQFSQQYERGVWSGDKSLMTRGRVPVGLFLATQSDVEQELGLQFLVKRIQVGVGCEFRSLPQKGGRDYQLECVEAMQLAAAKTSGGLILAATGTGKTRTAGLFFKSLVGNACFVVDELTLWEQGREELESVLGEKVGVVGNSRFETQRVTVATVQTLHKHRNDKRFRNWMMTLSVLVIDEVHVQLAKRNVQVLQMAPIPAVYGLTATLQLRRKDIRFRAWALTGPVIFEYKLKQGEDEGHLVRGVVFQIEV